MVATDTRTSERLDDARTVEVLSALAHPSRLDAFRLLVRYLPYGLSAGDIARLLAVQHNTLSSHLAILEKAELVASRREGRSIIYAAVIGTAHKVTSFMLKDCCAVTKLPASLSAASRKPFPAKRAPDSVADPLNVLVVCPGNSARSIMAEALLNREGAGTIRAFSGGSRPAARPTPHTISLLKDLGYETNDLRSKSWLEFAGPAAPKMDFVLTVCETPPAKNLPAWPGGPVVVNWDIPDPVMVRGADSEQREAFLDAYRAIADRVSTLVNLDLKRLTRPQLTERLIEIGASYKSDTKVLA